jgi:hypothetical protein
MPFLPELEKLVSNYPEEIIEAIKSMMDKVNDKTITIFTVKKLITKHLDPLLPHFNISNTFTKETTLNSIEETGKFIARQYSGNSTHGGVEYCIGETLRHLIRCCPRKIVKRYKLNPYDTQGFCNLCWRHTAIGDNFCHSHSPTSNNSAYQHRKRIHHIFNKELACIRASDKNIKAYDSFPFALHDKRATHDNIKKMD